ncbi:MAG: four helix bundle protein [Candidatus Colwellbacteria bacterium]|nr:four helix bundle protein [Candidatus Colwellbacteria bacterium]
MRQETRDTKQGTRGYGYRNLIVWQKADELAFRVYLVTKNFPKSETFTLVPQIRRAVISVPANIVEGYARSSKKEKRQFYSIARGSLTEVEYYLDFSLRLEYLSEKEHSELTSLRDEVGRLLSGLINSTKV